MYKWYLPTLGEIIASSHCRSRAGKGAQLSQIRSEQAWYGAIAALNELLSDLSDEVTVCNPDEVIDGASRPTEGVVLSGPFPILNQAELMSRFANWVMTGQITPSAAEWLRHRLPAAEDSPLPSPSTQTLPLISEDPLAGEPFCLVLTSEFSLVMSLGMDNSGTPDFLFSFVPDVAWQAWRSLRSRIQLTSPQSLPQLDALVEQFAPVTPDYRLVMDFSQRLVAHITNPLAVPSASPQTGYVSPVDRPAVVSTTTGGYKPLNVNHPQRQKLSYSSWHEVVASDRPHLPATRLNELPTPEISTDAELLKAIAHEVRTPLSTIRTLTRLLMRRKDISPQAMKRLEMIDRECTRQIDRFGLIFWAVELETREGDRAPSPLARTSLDQVFKQNIPLWQQQAKQHNLDLDVVLPKSLPMVVSDPTMLHQVLTGLIDRITHSLPAGSQIQLSVMPAGNQLKLQFRSTPQGISGATNAMGAMTPNFSSVFAPTLKSVGQMLMFQPETGNLSLNLNVTKNLFQALGGKLTVRRHPHQGEILTIFLPLDSTGEPMG
ncbi:MAG: HAMP domain-containing sensor histidine kinase [Synechococcales bacterium]|nr:HAMP domain-containing sensor histidine kinase [Synechococcales bacterium]